MRTPWGYDAEDIGPIVSLEQFHAITNCAYMDNLRLDSALYAASQAIRNYCGWHICPSVKCTAYPEGGAIVAKLPAGYVSEIVKITEDGTELSSGDYEWRRDGLLKRSFPRKWCGKWDSIEAEYMERIAQGKDPRKIRHGFSGVDKELTERMEELLKLNI